MNKIYQTTNHTFAALLVALFIFLTAINAAAQTSAFTYQGNLTDSSLAANGVYDFQFQLYNSLGNPSGTAINVDDITVTNGVFTVQLDFGAGAFQQVLLTSRSMEIRVRPGTSTGTYTALAPRQPFTAAPIAIAATKAETATNANFLGNVAANQYVQTNDSRLTDSRTPAAGSSSYIQNNATATAQPSTNFNISGNGKVGNTLTTFDALISNDLTVQNDVTIQGVFTGGGSGITGLNASNISTGTISTLRIPSLDASKITTGTFGTALIPSLDAAKITTGTFSDVRLSSNIPRLNTANTFTGTQSAGIFNAATQFNLNGSKFISASGTANTFVGISSGTNNTGQANSFFGNGAGQSQTSGNFNSFFGNFAGANNDGGNSNSFFGYNAGLTNNTGGNNTFVGFIAGRQNQMGNNNSFYGWSAGNLNSTGDDNTFIGSNAGSGNTTGNNNTVIGAGADLGANNLTYATAIGAGAVVSESDTTVIGRENIFGQVIIPSRLIVTRTITFIRGSGGGSQPLCSLGVNTFPGSVVLSTCGSSLRYKKDVENFTSGLDLVRRLRPVTFTWKSDNQRDLGFVAEEVNAVEPLMTTYNEKGEVEGVKYDRISAALVNAVNEQQTEITQQKETIERQNEQLQNQQRQIDALKQIVCAANPNTAVCRAKK